MRYFQASILLQGHHGAVWRIHITAYSRKISSHFLHLEKEEHSSGLKSSYKALNPKDVFKSCLSLNIAILYVLYKLESAKINSSSWK